MDKIGETTPEGAVATTVDERQYERRCRIAAAVSVVAATTAAWPHGTTSRGCRFASMPSCRCFTVAMNVPQQALARSATGPAACTTTVRTFNAATSGKVSRVAMSHGQTPIPAVLVSALLACRVATKRQIHRRLHAHGEGQFSSTSAAIQAHNREEKRKHETAHFFGYQKKLLKLGEKKAGEKNWDREERYLFGRTKMTQGINFENYDHIKVSRVGGNQNDEPCNSFQEVCQKFRLPKQLVDNINKCGYNKPTPVQKHAMPAALWGTDVMVSAQTGSGKTAAFLVPSILAALQIGRAPLEEGPIYPTCVILAPTRELCQQIAIEARKLCFRSSTRVVAVYGGEDAVLQLREMAAGCEIIIATPGRLQDFLERGVVSVTKVRHLVLDEADRMLDMGFEHQIRDIIEANGMRAPGPDEGGRQTMMFSATFPKKIQELALDFLHRTYLRISVGAVGSITENVEQRFKDVSDATSDEKFFMLVESVNEVKSQNGRRGKTLVFANQKVVVDDVTWKLAERRISSLQIHGGLTQQGRDKALNAFRNGRVDVLVATDVAARGLDLPGVDHVINYELPTNSEDYVHRIGRTGRIGNIGVATSMVTDYEPALRDIVKSIKDRDFREGSDTSIPGWVVSQATKVMGAPPSRGGGMGQDRYRGQRGDSLDSGRVTRQDRYGEYGGGRSRSSSARNGRHQGNESYDRPRDRRDGYSRGSDNDSDKYSFEQRMARGYGSSDRSRIRRDGSDSDYDDFVDRRGRSRSGGGDYDGYRDRKGRSRSSGRDYDDDGLGRGGSRSGGRPWARAAGRWW